MVPDHEERYIAYKHGLQALSKEILTALHEATITNKPQQYMFFLLWVLEHPQWEYRHDNYVIRLKVEQNTKIACIVKRTYSVKND